MESSECTGEILGFVILNPSLHVEQNILVTNQLAAMLVPTLMKQLGSFLLLMWNVAQHFLDLLRFTITVFFSFLN